MSIPNPFRPVCGEGETWLPYVQPVMTSRNTWSNEPSFGLAWQGVEGYADYNDWKCMADTKWWWANLYTPSTSLLTFDRQLRIASVTFGDPEGANQDGLVRRIAFEANVNGDWVMLGEWVRPNGMPRTESITLELSNVVASEFRVTNDRNGYTYSTLWRLQLNAFFKP